MEVTYSTYIQASADYCKSLFQTAECFFSANTLIECLIASGEKTNHTLLANIGKKLSLSSNSASDSIAKLHIFDLQHQIWAQHEFTRLTIKTTQLICHSLEWQCSLASTAHQAAGTVLDSPSTK